MKAYVKPVLYYERFELSQHVADCAWELDLMNQESCGFKGDPDFGFDASMKILTDDSICNETKFQYYCYTNGSGAMKIFAS